LRSKEDFFFEKKKQKTFALLRARCDCRARKRSKVFWFFFSKKNCFLCAPHHSTRRGAPDGDIGAAIRGNIDLNLFSR
jgi:hypothetical protein